MRARLSAIVIMSVIAALAAIGAASRTAAKSTMRAPAGPCASLENQTIAPAQIGLPTRGATIVSAQLVPASPLVTTQGRGAVLPIPEYCKVVGYIAPVDPGAPRINFQVNMPTVWNGKLAQMGGSGTNGVIPIALGARMGSGPESMPPDAPYAVSRGFVTYGSDSGHQNAPAAGRGAPAAAPTQQPPPDWMRNTEARNNLLFAQMKKTHDVTVALVKQLYDQPIRHSYYFGTSQGGREALIVVQRYPQDYDGVLAQLPAFAYTHQGVFDSLSRARAQAGDAWIPPAKVALIAKEVRRQCDALDGIEDGLMGSYMACDRKFDPSVTPDSLSALRCPDGKDTGDTCLSDAQIRAAEALHAPVKYPFPIYKGWTGMPGWEAGGETRTNWKTLDSATDANTPLGGNLALLVNDPSVKLLTVDLNKYRKEIQDFSALGDATDPDLSAFQRRGGKLVIKVNTADYSVNPRAMYAYYDKIVTTMGQGTVDRFARLYVAIGIAHNGNVGTNPLTNERVPSYVDFIGMIDDWVEKGTAPADTQVLTSMVTSPPFTVNASLPMCRYPMYPRYNGTGDPKNAQSYRCTK